MIRSTQFFAVLLGAALVASWMEWTAEEPVDLEGKVVVLDGDAEAVQAVRWIGEDTEATVTRKSDDRGDYFWVDYTRWTERPKPASESPDTGEVDEPKVERTATRSVFKSAKRALSIMKNLSPLAAKRSLEVNDPEKLSQLGLTTPASRLEIDRGGKTEIMEIGSEAYGTRDYYARHRGSGRIYMLERDLIQPLKYARTRLPDRTLYSFDRASIVRATLTADGQSAAWNQNNADDKQAAHWSPVDAPDDEAENANDWLDKLLNLKGTKYADPDDPPTDLRPRFALTLKTVDDSETLQVMQVGDDGDWYGQSAHTRGLIKLVRSGASDLSEDTSTLLGAGSE